MLLSELFALMTKRSKKGDMLAKVWRLLSAKKKAHDTDPCYLKELVSQDFYDFRELWQNSVTDMELITAAETVDRYCPIVEDISLDDSTLCKAVEEIEEQ